MSNINKKIVDPVFDEIGHYFGFIPPVFMAVQADFNLLDALWQQTRSTYINNPLPPVLKEKFFLYISYSCDIPYDLRSHCILLNKYGIAEHEIMALLQTPLPTVEQIDQHLQQLHTISETLDSWPKNGTSLEPIFFSCIVHLFLQHTRASSKCRKELQRLLGEHYMFLVALFNYIHTCHRWIESNPELYKKKDEQIMNHFDAAFGTSTRLHTVINEQFEHASQLHQQSNLSSLASRHGKIEPAQVSPEAEQHMNDFLGLAAHEIKTPITTIKGTIQILLRTIARERQKTCISPEEYIRTIEVVQRLLTRADNQVRRLTHLINDIVYISRIQDKKLDPRLERMDINSIVREVVQQQRQISPRRTIQASDAAMPVFVLIDRNHIGQVIMNYLSNALKYSSEEQPVEVSLNVEGPKVRIAVHDHGPGITKEDQQHIWERFYRVQHTEVLSGSGVGFGLGLYISRSIIEKHNGEIGVESTPGQGTTFWFSLAQVE
ncbi:sensor histidine kinase [Dictyobacter aurantiacus]|uniref:histidine kinase n=1 Tax=Dictyobacter aurantiacus TaxID=1936993 RepID=A0A401Z7M8_9CHLR|nr:HAMP domain-containing sensor histidine kinase [Dictyobacter aurantiacus]GCE02867.1 hypothetical protein KDAU_01960 [Dictyobacter aurantiacus]